MRSGHCGPLPSFCNCDSARFMAKHNGTVGIVNSGTSVFLLVPEEMGIITATLHMKLEIRGGRED